MLTHTLRAKDSAICERANVCEAVRFASFGLLVCAGKFRVCVCVRLALKKARGTLELFEGLSFLPGLVGRSCSVV